jgi:hypothetical protein
MVCGFSAFNALVVCTLIPFCIRLSNLYIVSKSLRIQNRPINLAKSWQDLLPTLLMVVGVSFLVRIPANAPHTLLESGLVPIWSDYFLHGITIASFGGPFRMVQV